MLTLQFLEQCLHFAVSLFAALAFFAVFWLYFDAWTAQEAKSKPDVLKWLGFLLVSLSFIVYATLIEQSDLGRSIFGNTGSLIANTLRLAGYLIIIAGQLLDPLQKKPDTTGFGGELRPEAAEAKGKKPKKSALALAAGNGFGVAFALPVAVLAIACLYWRRATSGLERHLRPVAGAFIMLCGFELFSLAQLFRDTNNPALFTLVKAFGPFWIASHVCLFIGIAILGRWVWKYLTERFMSQLFMTFIGTILVIFLVTTICFSFLLLRNVQSDALNNLNTAANVLNYALDSKKAEAEADANIIAANPAAIQAITAKDNKALVSLTGTFLESKHATNLVITTDDAQVVLRADDPNRWGDSISSDTLVRRALVGKSSSTVERQDSVLAPVISIRSVVPVRDGNGSIVGTASVSIAITNAFMDGIKHTTGLDSAIYSGDVRSATTITAADGTSRGIGVKETDPAVLQAVLVKGQTFKGLLTILNRQYTAVYTPLKDVDNTVVGMLFIGQPAVAILQTTAYAIELTFIIAIALLILSIIPAYFLARYIARQLE